MSLLMDALKKAEREREAQASKEQSEDNETPQELSLDPMEEQPEPELSQLGDEDEPWDILGELGEVSHGFDLSLTDSDLGLDSSSDPAPEPDGESEPPPEPQFEPHDLDGMEDIPLAASLDDDLSIEDTSSTMPSMKAVKASVDRYFDGSQSVSMSMQMPLEQDDATTVVQRRETHEEAQAAAQTVFAAKTPKRRSSTLVWVFVVPLVLILLVGGGFFYWVQITGGQGVGGTDLVALLGGSTGQSTTTTSIQTTTTTGTQATTTGETGATTQTASAQGETSTTQGVLEPALSDVLDIEPPAAGDLTPVELEPVVVEEPELAPVVEEVLPTAEELLASADAQIQSALDDQVMTEGELTRESVSFTRSRPEPKINAGVSSGYEAFQAGNYAQAERNYRRALSEEPTNRDALLGLAAIAVHKERWPVAAGIYTQLLRINPRDTVAQSAMICHAVQRELT